MHCPDCHKELIQFEKTYLCPDSHGELVNGGFIANIENGGESRFDSSNEELSNTGTVTCPHCSSIMHKVDFNSTGVIIDSCPACPFRWLGAEELTKIKAHKPNFKPEDLAYLASFENRTRENRAVNSDPNPKVPLFNWARLPFQRSPFIKLGILSSISSIDGMRNSKFLLIAIPTILIFVGVVYFMIIKTF